MPDATINTSGGIRGLLRMQRGQASWQIPEQTAQELEQRGYIVINRDDFVDAVVTLLQGDLSRLQGLIDALAIPQLSSEAGNLIVLDGEGKWLVPKTVAEAGAGKTQRVTYSAGTTGSTTITFTFTKKFADVNYGVSVVAKSDPAAEWAWFVVRKQVDLVEVKFYGLTVQTLFDITAEGNIE